MSADPSFVLAHAGGWDELLVLAIPVVVYLGMRWRERRSDGVGRRDEDAPP